MLPRIITVTVLYAVLPRIMTVTVVYTVLPRIMTVTVLYTVLPHIIIMTFYICTRVFIVTDRSLQDTSLHQLRDGVSSHDHRQSTEVQDEREVSRDVRSQGC